MTELGGDNGLYYDDLRIGQRFTSKTHVVDEEQIKAFARQFDPQPFHLIARLQGHSVFGLGGKRLAHGCDHYAPSGRGRFAGCRRYRWAGGELKWPNPTRPGDTLQVESEVLDLRPSQSRPDRGSP